MEAEEVVRAFGGRFLLDDRGNPLPIDPERRRRSACRPCSTRTTRCCAFSPPANPTARACRIVEGVPAGLALSEDYIAVDLRRRQGGYGRGRRQKIEQDRAEIISGVRHGRTLGSPIALSIQNRDWANWTEQMAVEPVESEVEKVTRLRPGHADLAGT